MTMHVNFSPEMEGFTKSKVSSGFYGNATEVTLRFWVGDCLLGDVDFQRGRAYGLGIARGVFAETEGSEQS